MWSSSLRLFFELFTDFLELRFAPLWFFTLANREDSAAVGDVAKFPLASVIFAYAFLKVDSLRVLRICCFSLSVLLALS